MECEEMGTTEIILLLVLLGIIFILTFSGKKHREDTEKDARHGFSCWNCLYEDKLNYEDPCVVCDHFMSHWRPKVIKDSNEEEGTDDESKRPGID
jgi:hypothetical protein